MESSSGLGGVIFETLKAEFPGFKLKISTIDLHLKSNDASYKDSISL